MVNPGRNCPKKYTADEIGEATVTALRRVMPAAMPRVNFLSGGEGEGGREGEGGSERGREEGGGARASWSE